MNQKILNIILGAVIVVLILIIICLVFVVKSQPIAQQPTPAQSVQSASMPTNSATNLGPMPKMSYKIIDSSCNQDNSYSDIALYANGKQVAVFVSGLCEGEDFGDVIFRTGNSEAVYFSVVPTGMGGYFSGSEFNLYKLDLNKKAVEEIVNPLLSFDLNSDLTKVIYTQLDNGNFKIFIKDLATNIVENFGMIPINSEDSHQNGHQMGNIKFSPDAKKAAVAFGYGPEKEYGEIYILDLSTKTLSLYKQVPSKHLQINSWKNNTEVDWSVL